MLIDRGFCVGLVCFPDANSVGKATKALKQIWTNFLEQVFRHVFGGWVVRHDEQPTRLDHSQGGDGVLILIANQEAVIPILVEPAFALGFQVGKIHDPPYGILRVACNEEVCDIVVSVEVLALATVLEQAMSGAELDSTHNTEAHNCVFRWARNR